MNHFKIHFVAYQISDIGDLVLDHSWSTKNKCLMSYVVGTQLIIIIIIIIIIILIIIINSFYIALKLYTYSKVPIKAGKH